MAAVLVAFAIGIGVYFVANQPKTVIAGVQCNTGEQLAVHYHAQLTIDYQGTPVTVPAYVGYGSNCLYWLHTHDTSGVIHIEAPTEAANRVFTLGDFFDVWGEPLSGSQVATLTVPKGDRVEIFTQKENDSAPARWTKDPRSVPLIAHETITIEIVPPEIPPTKYTFTNGL